MFATSCLRTLVRALSLAPAHVHSLSLGYMCQSIALAIFCVWYTAGVLIEGIRLELSALRNACKCCRLEQFIQKAIVYHFDLDRGLTSELTNFVLGYCFAISAMGLFFGTWGLRIQTCNLGRGKARAIDNHMGTCRNTKQCARASHY